MFYLSERHSRFYNSNYKLIKKYDFFGKTILVVLFVILVIIASFRHVNVGNDTLGYIRVFKSGVGFKFDFNKIIKLKQQEPLFYAITYFIGKMTKNYKLYFIIIYSIFTFGILKFLSNNFDRTMILFPIMLSIVNYIYSFSAIRSSLALSIVILAINLYRKNLKIKAVFLTILAVLFHYSSGIVFIFFIFYEICNRKFMKKKTVIFITILIFTTILYFSINSISSYLVTTKYRVYLDNPNNFKGQLPLVFLFVITFLNHKSLIKTMEDKKIYIYCIYFNVISIPAVMFLGGYRLGSYFDFPKIVVISYIIKIVLEKYGRNNVQVKCLVYFSSFIGIFIWTSYLIIKISSTAGLMPYTNILFQ